MSKTIIQVNNLHKKYGDYHAVKGISFSVNEGEIFGLLDFGRKLIDLNIFS